MKLIRRGDQNEIYKELVEVLKIVSKLKGDDYVDAYESILHIATLVGGEGMNSLFRGRE